MCVIRWMDVCSVHLWVWVGVWLNLCPYMCVVYACRSTCVDLPAFINNGNDYKSVIINNNYPVF